MIWNEVQITVNWQIFDGLVAVAEIRVNVYFWFRIRLSTDFDEFSEFGLSVNSVKLNAGLVDLIFSFEENFETIVFEWLLL